MKFTVTFKDPNAVHEFNETIEKVWQEALVIANRQGIELVPQEVDEIFEKFLEWGELITIEFDTVELTARVIPKGE
jgi:hypothetical protein